MQRIKKDNGSSSVHHVEKMPNAPYNSTLRLTCGLSRTYRELHSKAENVKQETEVFTSLNGDLSLHKNMPLLASRYEFVRPISEGAFSQIVECVDRFVRVGGEENAHRRVAVKVMNMKYGAIGMQEARKIRTLQVADPLRLFPLIYLSDTFTFNNHFCLVFELMDTSLLSLIQAKLWESRPTRQTVKREEVEAHHEMGLHQLIESSKMPVPSVPSYVGQLVPLSLVRKVGFQLCSALALLHTNDCIHADLKPENILLSKGENGGYRVRLIDFGNSMSQAETSAYHQDFELQSLLYRAPEVLFGVPFEAQIDMWSIGCILLEMLIGVPVFASSSKAGLVSKIVTLLGLPQVPEFENGIYFRSLISHRRSRSHSGNVPGLSGDVGDDNEHDDLHLASDRGEAGLKQRSQLLSETFRQLRMRPESAFAHLDKLLAAFGYPRDLGLLDFLLGLLTYSPSDRLTPQNALRHRFFASLVPLQALEHVCRGTNYTEGNALAEYPYIENSLEAANEQLGIPDGRGSGRTSPVVFKTELDRMDTQSPGGEGSHQDIEADVVIKEEHPVSDSFDEGEEEDADSLLDEEDESTGAASSGTASVADSEHGESDSVAATASDEEENEVSDATGEAEEALYKAVEAQIMEIDRLIADDDALSDDSVNSGVEENSTATVASKPKSNPKPKPKPQSRKAKPSPSKRTPPRTTSQQASPAKPATKSKAPAARQKPSPKSSVQPAERRTTPTRSKAQPPKPAASTGTKKSQPSTPSKRRQTSPQKVAVKSERSPRKAIASPSASKASESPRAGRKQSRPQRVPVKIPKLPSDGSDTAPSEDGWDSEDRENSPVIDSLGALFDLTSGTARASANAAAKKRKMPPTPSPKKRKKGVLEESPLVGDFAEDGEEDVLLL